MLSMFKRWLNNLINKRLLVILRGKNYDST